MWDLSTALAFLHGSYMQASREDMMLRIASEQLRDFL